MKHKNTQNKAKILIGLLVIVVLVAAVIIFTGTDTGLLTGASKKKKFQDSLGPTVELVSPPAEATVSGVTEISANATDNVRVTRVEFSLNGQVIGTDDRSPYTYSWDTTTATNGSHRIGARAFDGAGNSTSVSNRVTVSNIPSDTTPPTVEIEFPAYSGVVRIRSHASDDVGVTRVEFLVDGNVIGSDSDSPYFFNWDSTLTNYGVHRISARAFDAASNSSESEEISIIVDNR